jgi:hypothetical protein
VPCFDVFSEHLARVADKRVTGAVRAGNRDGLMPRSLGRTTPRANMSRSARKIVPLEPSELYHKHYLCQVITGKNFLSSKIAAAEGCKPTEECTKTFQTRSLDQAGLPSRPDGNPAAKFDTLWLRR